MKKNLLAIGIIAGLIVGCDEDGYPSSNSFEVTYSSSPNNFLDSIKDLGVIHNDACRYILKSYSALADTIEFLDTNQISFTNNLFDYKVSVPHYIDSLTYYDGNQVDTTNLEMYPSNTFSNFQSIGNSYQLSSSAIDLLSTLDSNFDDYKSGFLSLTELNDACNSIINQAILLTDTVEQIAVGAGASVLINSLYFWNENEPDSLLTNIASSTISNQTQKYKQNTLQKISDTDEVAFADASGAVVGAVDGGLVGSGVPVLGTLSGASLGAVTYAIVSSLGEAASQEAGLTNGQKTVALTIWGVIRAYSGL